MATDSKDLSRPGIRTPGDRTRADSGSAPRQRSDAGRQPSEDDVERSLAILMNPKASDQRIDAIGDAGDKIGKYRIERILGCHGQATVLLARDPDLSRRVVLKLYHEGVTGQHRQRIINEGRALARLHNPHVSNCYGVEEAEGCLILVLEYVPGRSLEDWLADCRPSLEDRLDIIRQLATGLVPAHRRGLLHRDLKPSNVIVSPRGVAKLIDFGLVQSVEDGQSDASGTPAFLPPEVARDGEADERSDVFGLGAILFYLLTGKAPFQGFDSEEARTLACAGDIPERDELLANTPAPVAELCKRLLHKRVDKRPVSMIDVIHRVDEVLIHRRRRRRRLILAVPLVALILASAWLAWRNLASETGAHAKTAFHRQGSRPSTGAAATKSATQVDNPVSNNELAAAVNHIDVLNDEATEALAANDLATAQAKLAQRINVAREAGLGDYYSKLDSQRLNYLNELGRDRHGTQLFMHAVTLANAEVLLREAASQIEYPCCAEELTGWIDECRLIASELANALGENHVETWRASQIVQLLKEQDASEDIHLARRVHRQARLLFGSMSDATHAAMYRLAVTYLSKEGNPGTAERLLEQGYETAVDGPAPARRWAAQFLRLRAKSLVGLPRFNEANHCLFKSRKILKELSGLNSHDDDMMEQLGMESYVLDLCGSGERALDAAMRLEKQLDLRPPAWEKHAVRCMDIAHCFAMHNLEEDAIKHLEHAVELAGSGFDGEIRGRARTLYNVVFRGCAMANALGRRDLEESYVEKALELSKSTGVGALNRDIHLQRVLSSLRFKKGEVEQAKQLLAAAESDYAELQNLPPYEKCVHLLGFSALHMALGQTTETRRTAAEALELAELARDEQVAGTHEARQWQMWALRAKKMLDHADRKLEVQQVKQ